MAGPFDVADLVISVSADVEPEVWAPIEDITDYEATHGREEPAEVRVFNKADPYRRGGAKTNEYSMSGLLNLKTTGGQNVLQQSYENDTVIKVQFLFLDSPQAGYQQRVKVSEYTDNGEADGDYIRCTFALTRESERELIVPAS
jgi:hypothetical protein